MDQPIVIIDNGSGYLKAGFSNQKTPQITMPTLIGRHMLRYETTLDDPNSGLQPIMFGDQVLPYRSLLELSHPIRAGKITNEEDLENLWKYCLEEKLGITDYSDMSILLTEAPLNPIANKKIMCNILFDKFGFDKVNIEPQAKLSLYSQGLDTGIVLDSGDGVTHCIPIANGLLLHHFIERLDIAGRNITEYLIRLMQLKGYSFNSSADFEMIRDIKEKMCFVSCELEKDRKLDKETTFFNSYYLLPDGSRIKISNEKYEAPEILFKPYLIQYDQDGIPEMLFKSINACPIDTKKSLYEHIVLSGATTMFPGFATRVENDLRDVYTKKALKDAEKKKIKIKINVIDNFKRKNAVFIGATIMANYYNNAESFDYWISRDEWNDEENQDEVLRLKCPNVFKDTIIRNNP